MGPVAAPENPLGEEFTARWWHALADGRLQCDLCPRQCRLREDQHGACWVRQRRKDRIILIAYGRSSGFCIDPIEKKPLHHFYPGSTVLSFGTAGCNLVCKFCQNWDISKSREVLRMNQIASPEAIAQAAHDYGARSVAFTYNDPVIFAEYALDCARACKDKGIAPVAVTAGYMHLSPAREFFSAMDAANIDLKAFSEDFYVRLCGGHLNTVLDVIALAVHDTPCWVELTTLLIPGCNDSDSEIAALSSWVVRALGAEIPVHFSAYHPAWKLTHLPPTPASRLQRARRIAQDAGLQHVYIGNIRDLEGGTTRCPGCGKALIVRDGYQISDYAVDTAGRCLACGKTLAGCFGP
jgi:pyruvate formate lyase activating enzyme